MIDYNFLKHRYTTWKHVRARLIQLLAHFLIHTDL